MEITPEAETSLRQELESIKKLTARLKETGRIGEDFQPRKEYFIELIRRIRKAREEGILTPEEFDESVGEYLALKDYTSDHDTLTGLYNFRGYQERIESSVAAAERHGAPLSFMIIDIDHFKQLNDELGHDIGNLFLISLATLLEVETRKEDFLARYGGEEFVVILPNVDQKSSAVFAERLRQKTSEYLKSSVPEANVSKPVTISIGVGQWRKGETPIDFFQRIDRSLLEAKKVGRDKVVVAE